MYCSFPVLNSLIQMRMIYHSSRKEADPKQFAIYSKVHSVDCKSFPGECVHLWVYHSLQAARLSFWLVFLFDIITGWLCRDIMVYYQFLFVCFIFLNQRRVLTNVAIYTLILTDLLPVIMSGPVSQRLRFCREEDHTERDLPDLQSNIILHVYVL